MKNVEIKNNLVKQNGGGKSSWLDKKLILGLTPAYLLVIAIMLFSLGLHLINLSAIGDGNTYYTAAVKSMLQSWKNFFYVAAEPGGSVTVDKPPLGFWIETLFAYLFSLSGFTVSLPNIISGVLSIPLLFHLTRKYFGTSAGIIAGLVYAITPVVIATDRNNTIDAMLVFTLLLAAWAFIKATESGKFIHLVIASVLVGLAFNIKMMQAYLPLPAFMALYFFGAKIKWGKKILNLFLSGLIILTISFSWALIVDFTPTDQRPYIGSSDNNTVTELIIGYNGLARLFGRNRDAFPAQGYDAIDRPGQMPPSNDSQQPFQGPSRNMPDGQAPNGGNPPAAGDDNFPMGYNADNRAARGGFNMSETGQPGILRLFQRPLANEMSWLLPFSLIGILILVFSKQINLKELSDQHKGVVLWGTWLVTCLVFFSMADFFHAYYLIMFAPPLAVLAGGCFQWFEQANRDGRFWKKAIFILICGLTLAFEIYAALQYLTFSKTILIPLVLFIPAAILFLWNKSNRKLKNIGALALFFSLLLIPAWWSVQTALNPNQSRNLPAAYSGEGGDRVDNMQKQPGGFIRDNLITYLQEHTLDTYYLVAVESSMTGAPIVLETGRPVLYMGGFAGGDAVVDADGLAEMVSNGDLRYVLTGGDRGGQGGMGGVKSEITSWLSTNCTIVNEFSQTGQQPLNTIRDNQTTLYECQP